MNIENDIDDLDGLLEFEETSTSDIQAAIEPTLSVREINDAISESISLSFPRDIWVKGEVQRLRFHSSGHVYFDLVDASSKGSQGCTIPVTLLKWNAGKIKGDLREILVEDREVRIRARPDFYAPYGKMSLAASDIDTAYTLGQIALARRELIAKLSADGLLRSNAENDLEELICNVALVTSIDSAAYHDVVDQLRNSEIGFKIIAINALMQGHDSPTYVISALDYASNLDVDVVLLCRGGGAKSDLATFDSEIVARKISSMSIPVITGLGHQIDVSVADIVAHSSLKTPTACAQFIIDRTQKAFEAAKEGVDQIEDIVIERITTSETRLANISQRLSDVAIVLDRSSQALIKQRDSLGAATSRAFANSKISLNSITSLLNAHDPLRVLERGYSLTSNMSGKTVRSFKDLKKEDEIITRFADGEVNSKVTLVKNKGK